ncbi:MAG: hypothetical protein ACJAU6_001487 [Alphaproteobacteria bacterium]|jgi:hypothetical protein
MFININKLGNLFPFDLARIRMYHVDQVDCVATLASGSKRHGYETNEITIETGGA